MSEISIVLGSQGEAEALALFWDEYELWRLLVGIDGNDDLERPRIEAHGPGGRMFRVDGAQAPRKCDVCGWPALRDWSLDEPVTVSDGSPMGGTWGARRCAADPAHVGMELVGQAEAGA